MMIDLCLVATVMSVGTISVFCVLQSPEARPGTGNRWPPQLFYSFS
jgi:hypothetical protein